MATAVDKAYRAIRDGVISGAYPPGAHLTAQDLASTIGLSRTPVREAMRRLHAEGLITFVANRGAFVAELDERDVFKIYDLRVVLEAYAAETAAQEATDEQIAQLEALAAEMAAVVEGQAGDFIERVTQMNNSFHKLIVTAAANPRLETALSSIVEAPLVLRTFRRYEIEELRRSMHQHTELAAALRARDGAWARSVMSSHILAGRNALLRSLSAPSVG